MTMDSCRRLVGGNPEPAAARVQAEKLAKKNELLDCQFLLFKYAGEKGDNGSARILGTFYDPDTWSKDKSPLPAPNPLEAARWHKQAAEAGDAESQYRYGMLLKLGRTDATDGPEQAQAWLRKAAEQGHKLAKEELAR
jgi:TPR repeat protein